MPAMSDKARDSKWGKDPLQTALFKMVTRNMWQFLKSDSIFSIDSILGKKVYFTLDKYRRS